MDGPVPAAEARFEEYLEVLSAVVGHRARRGPLRAYLTGLFLPGKRKSVEPMAAQVDARRLGALHQSMHHFVANSPWDEGALIRAARDWALPALERHGVVTSWVVREVCIRKTGDRSVGVTRQRCAGVERPVRCQVAVSVWLVHPSMSIPVAVRLYLPRSWTRDPSSMQIAGVPQNVGYRPRASIVLDVLDELLADGIPRAPVLTPAGYADAPGFADALRARRLYFALPAPAGAFRKMAASQWSEFQWREGYRTVTSRFADAASPKGRRLVEWPAGDRGPSVAWHTSLPGAYSLRDQVHLTRSVVRAERDLDDMNRELGLGHYEGRGWRGFHHHAALCVAAFAFLAAERARLAPPMPLAFLQPSLLPPGFLPRGAALRR